jgi:hypothetical protein
MAKTSPWGADEMSHLRNGALSHEQVAELTGRTYDAVRIKRNRLKIEPAGVVTKVEDDVARHQNEYWRGQYDHLKKKYESVLKTGAAVDQLVSMAADLAPRSYETAPPVFVKRPKSGKKQSAVLMLTDTHVGAVIKPNQTLGFGGYNFQIFLQRLKFLERGVESILTDHVSTDVPELVVLLGGDFLHGNLSHSVEAGQVNTLFTQYYGASHAVAQFLRNVSRLAPKVRIYTVVGNHTRWGTQKKMPTENRFSNLDFFTYSLIEALTKDLKNVEWHLDSQPFAVFDIQGFRFHASHGDHLKGGDKALGIPNHAVGRMVSSTTQLFSKREEMAPHYYLTGHLHRSITLPHARGSFIINGGFPGLDGYGLMSGFTPADPTQTLFFVHPVYGKTATFDIQLKFAPNTGPTYEIPVCGDECV